MRAGVRGRVETFDGAPRMRARRSGAKVTKLKLTGGSDTGVVLTVLGTDDGSRP